MIMCAALDEIGEGVIVCIDGNPVVEPHDWERVAHRTSMIVGLSPDAVPQAAEVAGGSFDFVLIDGDHTTNGVRRDVEGLLPLLAPDSYVVFHDSHYWQVGAAIDQSLVAFSHVLVDCGTLSRQEQPEAEGRVESGHPVVWGGIRLLRYLGPHGDIPPWSVEPCHSRSYLDADRLHPLRRYDASSPPLSSAISIAGSNTSSTDSSNLACQTSANHEASTSRRRRSPRWTSVRTTQDGTPPSFDTVVSQVVSESQFSHPDFQRLRGVLFPSVGLIPCGSIHVPSTDMHRKLWEWCYILRAAEQHGKLVRGAKAVGFGVGSEPLPAALAHFGLSVLATDRAPEASEGWAALASTWQTSDRCRSQMSSRKTA